MEEKGMENLFIELAAVTAEPVRAGLAEDIKRQIPQRLISHRGGLDTINVVIDLRVSKLAAAAVIIITMVLFARFFNGSNSTGGDIFQDGKALVKYFLKGKSVEQGDAMAAVMSNLYENLARQGRDVRYYGSKIGTANADSVLMQWKLSNGEYGIIFGDLSQKTVSADELVELQANMLLRKVKK